LLVRIARGTSMLAAIIGYFAVSTLGPESDLVRVGAITLMVFWEKCWFVALNDEVLNELGGAWDLPPKAEEILNHRRLEPLRVKRSLLIEGFDSASIWGWKDSAQLSDAAILA